MQKTRRKKTRRKRWKAQLLAKLGLSAASLPGGTAAS